jgi:hypothetical protein
VRHEKPNPARASGHGTSPTARSTTVTSSDRRVGNSTPPAARVRPFHTAAIAVRPTSTAKVEAARPRLPPKTA